MDKSFPASHSSLFSSCMIEPKEKDIIEKVLDIPADHLYSTNKFLFS